MQGCVDLCYVKANWLGFEPATCQSQAQRPTAAPTRNTHEPHISLPMLSLEELKHTFTRSYLSTIWKTTGRMSEFWVCYTFVHVTLWFEINVMVALHQLPCAGSQREIVQYSEDEDKVSAFLDPLDFNDGSTEIAWLDMRDKFASLLSGLWVDNDITSPKQSPTVCPISTVCVRFVDGSVNKSHSSSFLSLPSPGRTIVTDCRRPQWSRSSAVPFILSLRRCHRVTESIVHLHWHPVSYRIQFKLCCLMQASHYVRSPTYLLNIVQSVSYKSFGYCLRSTNFDYYI